MERYSHLQNNPKSPLTPLTPLSENTAFDFNFDGDGSLDMYVDSVRHKHKEQKQQQHVERPFLRERTHVKPRNYSDHFLKIRDVFEPHEACSVHTSNKDETFVVTPRVKVTKVKGATPVATSTMRPANDEYVVTPTRHVRSAPLRQRCTNILLGVPQVVKGFVQQQLMYRATPTQKLALPQDQENEPEPSSRVNKLPPFRKASPVAAKPLSPRIAKLLDKTGLSVYGSVFQREEIDMDVFLLMQPDDLEKLGISCDRHREIIMSAINVTRKVS